MVFIKKEEPEIEIDKEEKTTTLKGNSIEDFLNEQDKSEYLDEIFREKKKNEK